MKILHFIGTLGGGGAESMLAALIEGTRAAGWENVVVAAAAGPFDATAERTLAAAHRVWDLDIRSFFRPRALFRLWRIIRQERPDVVQTWMHKPDLIGGIIARLAGCRRVVWGIHSLDVYSSAGDSAFRKRLLCRALAAASRFIPQRIISCARTAITSHAAIGYPECKMLWIGNGMDPERFRPNTKAAARLRAELKIPADAPVAGFTGRLAHPVKDFPAFLRAAALVQKQRPEAHFIACGDPEGIEAEEIQAAMAAVPDRSKLHFVPFRGDIENVYPAFTAMALTSRSEASPMVLIEAMACGVPCVATDVGDSASIVGDAGRAVPVGDAPATAAALLELFSSGPAMRERARELSASRFSLSACIRSYMQIYRGLTGGMESAPLPVANVRTQP